MSNQKSSVEHQAAEHLRQVRVASGVTQQQVATHMYNLGFKAWKQTTVAKTESGARPLRLDEFVALCEILGQSPSEALEAMLEDGADERQRIMALRTGVLAARMRYEEAQAAMTSAATILHAAEATLQDALHGESGAKGRA